MPLVQLKYFNTDGSLKAEHLPFGDPYRDARGPESSTFSGRHYSENGFDFEVCTEADEVVELGTCRATSVAAKIHHAELFSGNTGGNYSAACYWR